MYYINMENIENQKYIEIGMRIKDARDNEGMTQSELAKRLGYSSPTFISLIEDGKRKVRIDDLEKIGQILHRDVNYFIQGSTVQKPSVQMALRAEKGLTQDDVEKVETLIETLKLMKKKQDGRDRANK